MNFEPLTAQKDAWGVLLFGAAIGLLFCAIANGRISGVLVLYAPTLIFLLLGFVRGTSALSLALLGSALAVLLMLSAPAAIIFLGTMAVPVWLFISQISHRRQEYFPTFTPTCHALSWLAFYGAAIMLGIFAVPETATQIRQFFIQELLAYYQAHGMEASELIQTKTMLNHAAPLVFASILWVWVMLMYGLAALAHYIAPTCGQLQVSLPPMALFRPLPNILLAALTLACIVSLTAPTPHWRDLAQSLSLALMMPLFWLGIAATHLKLAAKRVSKPFYWVLYVLIIIFLPFSPLFFLAFGLVLQLKASLPSSRRHI